MYHHILPTLKDQARIFGRYLVGQNPRPVLLNYFARAVKANAKAVSSADKNVLVFVFGHPRLMPYLDAYLALMRPESELRKRLYVMLSILEASPDFVDYFLPRQRSILFVALLPFICLRSGYRFVVGALIIKVAGL